MTSGGHENAGAALEVRGLYAGYGHMPVVSAVDLTVGHGELVALVGRNGVGKSTMLHAVSGFRHGGNAGEVTVDGQRIDRLHPHQVLDCGLALVPEGHRIFPELSVQENLLTSGFLHRSGFFLRGKARKTLERAYELFPVLADKRSIRASALSGGQQQMLAVGQALMTRPRCLLLDEPAAGLAPKVAEELYFALHQLTNDGLGVLVVDQDIARALRHSMHIYVMEAGRTALEGASSSFDENELVRLIVQGTVS